MPDISASTATNSSNSGWISFVDKASKFVQKTQEHVLQGINPGGIYQAIWCRDAAYILRDWFLSGNVGGVMQQIYQIWSHQIEPNKEKLVYGRGSPEMKFLSEVAKEDKQKEFEGALPTTIYQAGFSEVYGLNPDIDSTALMTSTSAWILARSLKNRQQSLSQVSSASDDSTIIASEHSSDYISALLSKLGITDPLKVAEYVVPRMLTAVEYLSSRDIDDDDLLEQNHNEDWMDTVLRAGKIVYSQACWILALRNLASLLSQLGRDDDSDRISRLSGRAIMAVDQNLWSEEDGCYLDIQETHHIGGPYRTLTQDGSLYLGAITENPINDRIKSTSKYNDTGGEAAKNILDQRLYNRSLRTLDAIKSRVWKEKWPLVTEADLKATGPWILKPYHYHNQTFWPWTTGIEMLARSRFDRVEESDILFSKLASDGHPHMHTYYEWINPITDEGSGAYPFRTGISAVRASIADIIGKIK
jgi:hypothetical protein